MHATHLRLNQADSAESAPQNNNLLGLDAVRAWAAVGVVMLHACVPYSDPDVPGLTWATTDTPHMGLTALMWAIEIVIMPIFLVMAGFLAFRSMSSRGPLATLKSRTRRLGWPFLLAVIFLIPVDLYAWLLGWLADGVITPRQMRALKFAEGQDEHLWGLSHLWFLQYLILYIAVLAGAWKWLQRIDPARAFRVGMPLTMLAAVLVLCIHPEVVWGFQHAFLPVPSKWLYSGCAFAMGVLIAHADSNLVWLRQIAGRTCGPSVMLCVATTVLGIWVLRQTSSSDVNQASAFPVVVSPITWTSLALLTVASATGVSLTLIGMACRLVKKIDPITQRLATASFAIYLLHHPILVLFHVAAKHGLPTVSPVFKMALGTTVAVWIPVGMHFVLRGVMARRASKNTSQSGQETPSILPMPMASETLPSERRLAG
ncbi:acyltransferase family protein [Rhodopirellula bahusiensis]|uniref:Acyltransferase n=1 Tax=Rhodopirellula bahusiensis TaxID=2014065 RepID=A0A2G1W2W4_9BACT|nr:acyltransferase family protein [Rhodopirellula bahusiensis]PHQ33009.1 acyltransferase [Rhodopirellula bahusiensis]